MKQLLALMTVFLVLMLVISTVMAVGNVKQSEQMTQRAHLISSLRADLRQAKQDQEQLSEQLDRERSTAKTLRTERDALNKRFSGLMTVLRYQSAGYTDVHALSGNGYVRPMGTAHQGDRLAGEGWLQAQALQQVLSRLLTERTAALADQPEDTSTPSVLVTERVTFAPNEAVTPTPAATASVSPALSPEPTIAPAVAITPSPAPTVAPSVSPTASPAPNPSANPAIAVVTPPNATTASMPSATPTPSVSSTFSPAPTIAPSPTPTPNPGTTPTLATTTAPEATASVPERLPTLSTALVVGLNEVQHFLRWMEQAVENLTNALLQHCRP